MDGRPSGSIACFLITISILPQKTLQLPFPFFTISHHSLYITVTFNQGEPKLFNLHTSCRASGTSANSLRSCFFGKMPSYYSVSSDMVKLLACLILKHYDCDLNYSIFNMTFKKVTTKYEKYWNEINWFYFILTKYVTCWTEINWFSFILINFFYCFLACMFVWLFSFLYIGENIKIYIFFK